MQKYFSKKFWAYVSIFATLLILAFILRNQGRLWFCACGKILIWFGDAWSSNTSQHLFDPYSFTHFLHGFLFCWLLMLIFPRFSREWQLWVAVTLESGWEVIENSSFVIERYRETAALGYYGDSIINSFGDVISCGIGFAVAKTLGVFRALIVFLLIEAVLLFWIRDGLLLNIVMLVYPFDEIKQWQSGH